MLKPESVEDLQAILRTAHGENRRVEALDLSGLNRLVNHSPEDMTAKVMSGMSLKAFQEAVGEAGQGLPCDPPPFRDWSVGEVLAENASGPRRHGYGTIRDYLIGISVVLADGTLIKAGGNVVKNVAGYDLCKLFIGSQGTLGVIVEGIFKLLPLPEACATVQMTLPDLTQAGLMVEKVHQSKLQPTVLDLHGNAESHTAYLQFEGAREDVEHQREVACEMGFVDMPDRAVLSASVFWGEGTPHRTTVLPSDLVPLLRKIAPSSYVARAGNGIVYFHGGNPPPPIVASPALSQRIKKAYDPKGVLPELTL
jgi:FAD/FMN-containing dehydrogenase